MSNTTQPLKIIIENPITQEVVSNKGASCNIASNIQNDWAIQSEKFSIENMENIKGSYIEGGENSLTEFNHFLEKQQSLQKQLKLAIFKNPFQLHRAKERIPYSK